MDKKLVLEEKKSFPILGCLRASIFIFLGLLLAAIISGLLIPDVREYFLTTALKEASVRFSSPEVPKAIDSTRAGELETKVAVLSTSNKVVEEMSVSEDELNAILEKRFRQSSNTNVDVRVKLKEREAKIFLKVKDKDMPWVEATILNTNTGHLQLKDIKLGPVNITAENLRDGLKQYKVGLEDVNFEKIDELLSQALETTNSKYMIDTVDVYLGYIKIRFIKK
jgi:hypothetical protein